MSSFLSTREVADMAGVHKDTLLRWLRDNAVAEPSRNRHGWRIFSQNEAQDIVAFANKGVAVSSPDIDSSISKLLSIEWDFAEAKTNYLTHGIHPYPAKFIPQIPNALIQELSSVGETVADIFCGSGTTLLEALQLKRHAVGIDANPLASLISSAKTHPLNEQQFLILEKHRTVCSSLQGEIKLSTGKRHPFLSKGERPDAHTCEFWFLPHVVEELAELRCLIGYIKDQDARRLCEVSLSAIIVNVSKQDSDTRYVRREKAIVPGDTVRKYLAQLSANMTATKELTDLIENRFRCTVYNENILNMPETEPIDLVVTSPPYPNAFSYHLYHRTRLLWLGHDPENFKRIEIGSHRKYSAKGPNRATPATFQKEFEHIFLGLRTRLRDRRHACFVIGDSTLGGEKIDNASLISDAGRKAGFREVARLSRTIQATKKAFNPKIGKIKDEIILVLQKD